MSSAPKHKRVKTADLIPYARNARTHNEPQVAQIAASIREFGFINPVIIDGKNGIIAGHGRVLAAQKLKMESVPCIEVSHLSEAQKRAYIIADNKLGLNADWDYEMLKIELDQLKEDNFDVSLVGFDDDELNKLFDDPTDDLEEEEFGANDDGEFLVIIECVDEIEQESLYRELSGRGIKVRVME